MVGELTNKGPFLEGTASLVSRDGAWCCRRGTSAAPREGRSDKRLRLWTTGTPDDRLLSMSGVIGWLSQPPALLLLLFRYSDRGQRGGDRKPAPGEEAIVQETCRQLGPLPSRLTAPLARLS